ncbi:site-specific integrase [Klebsiella grimontii]|uniref:tyrosine-type recombinase/integrase n=1 Tax=Klebsiella grimontii TaxID=2058152 RepID=UPI000E35673A|nr:site-specific integrase [Klebsiella grimontii]RFP41670.1 integrase [Klebsiella oxytoca]MBZ6971701.1 site-specific integrase [Klebsiella grimontii]MBZ7825748.1 site-specific integrase [Klebsiella grimontii]MDM4405818.1 site-specific integrase [Klebsiella grimontii]QTP39151.1 site-specific integrase [Klebsiella grimontii]
MATMITQDRQVANLTPDEGKTRIVVSVKSKAGSGLSVESRRGSRTKSWLYRPYLNGKQIKITLGAYPAMTLAQAREEHAEAVELVKQGIDPRYVRKTTKQQNEQMPIFSQLWESWLAFRAESKPIGARTLSDYEGTFRRHLEKGLGSVRVCDLSRALIYEHFIRVRKTSAEGVRKGLILLNMTLDHATLQGFIDHNPARLLKPAMFGASMGKPRERWLPRDELQMLWKALDEAGNGGGGIAAGGQGIASSVILSQAIANVLRLIIFTGVRRSEAVNMRWEQINSDHWVIPETKNGKSHIVTLHPLVLTILKRQRIISEGGWVFESLSKPGFPVTGDAITRALERLRTKYMVESVPFSPHDLRRSVATGCAEYLDAPERLIELLLNHVPKDRLIRTYQVGQQAEKLRSLFLKWGDFIEHEIIQLNNNAPDNVVEVSFGRK